MACWRLIIENVDENWNYGTNYYLMYQCGILEPTDFSSTKKPAMEVSKLIKFCLV